MGIYTLSHRADITAPVYPSLPGLEIRGLRQIKAGDSKNIAAFTMTTHSGTHIDFPAHIGQEIAVPWAKAADLCFGAVVLLDIPKIESELVEAADLIPFSETIRRADLVLIRTGFERFRQAEPDRYASCNPGLAASAAEFLIAHCPRLRAVGIDSVSIGAFRHREQGRIVHELLLSIGPHRTEPVLIIEDMRLADFHPQTSSVVVLPLLVGLDGSPCEIIGHIEHGLRIAKWRLPLGCRAKLASDKVAAESGGKSKMTLLAQLRIEAANPNAPADSQDE